MKKNTPISPRLVIAGTHSGCGKTTITTALMAAFSSQGRSVVPFKVGPDFIDPSFHEFVTGCPSHSLDSWLLSEQTVQHLFLSHTCQKTREKPYLTSEENPLLTKQEYPRLENEKCSSLTAKENLSLASRKSSLMVEKNACLTREENLSLAIIEGVMGLYDGHSNTTVGSTAHIASLLHAPTLLVVDAQGMSLSMAALVSGYARFRSQNIVSGVIFNKLSGEKHYKLLADMVYNETGISCFGFMPRNQDITLKRRHLGLIPSGEVDDLITRIQILSEDAKQYLDLTGIATLAESAPPLEQKNAVRTLSDLCLEKGYAPKQENSYAPESESSHASMPESVYTQESKRSRALMPESFYAQVPENAHALDHAPERTPRIGVLKDVAFSFYYHDNLALLEALGAKLIYISPIKDTALPTDLDGLYLGGGFPEVFAKELSANARFRTSLGKALTKGLPAYAECGGMMYLMEEIVDIHGRMYPMVGFFEGKALMTPKKGPFGYITVELLQDSLLGATGTTLRAHEFHHSCIHSDFPPVASMRKENGESWQGGMIKEQTLAWYPHIHFYSSPELAKSFVSACMRKKEHISFAS